ncbi:hypothetical protein BN874_120080 [Candidatus Contendobacter odensis Run_B_J11]|uniref:Uncharacterized protein n=1 Tax=Candidatus Contendobacter odensis Run_B_J11 TaxID=1400861 RepID=A0A7U7G7T1_9GAMM|nr:hypothetical protein BN874_120080 [Candidatus Contendobacter odensis Run_B_J11]
MPLWQNLPEEFCGTRYILSIIYTVNYLLFIRMPGSFHLPCTRSERYDFCCDWKSS